ncbi:OB-fold domain-containing protein [Desulfonema ishimotonii]
MEREVEAPYTIVMVELDEGPWIAGNLIDIDPDKTGMALMGRRVKLGHKLFPGDRYSGGEAARPLFSFED